VVKVAVVGAGVVGLATTASLLSAGADVTCFEAAAPMSQRSAGSSRIFRLAHTEPVLVDLAGRSKQMFRQWARAFGRELIRDVGVVVAGDDVPRRAAAMAAAGATHQVREAADGLALPARSVGGPFLLDPAGGVLDAAGVGEYLRARTKAATVLEMVYRIEELASGTRVWTPMGSQAFDAVVVAAGTGTCHLVAQVGLYTPSTLLHHLRLTFPLRDGSWQPPALLDHSQAWRPGFTTYQHLTEPGRWAVGADFDPAQMVWELGRDQVAERSRRLTLDYVRDDLDGVEDRVVDELYCAGSAGFGDGYRVVRTASVITLYGENLFKLAPVIGQVLARAVRDGSLPDSTLAGAA
jgi:sarcosine oxidase